MARVSLGDIRTDGGTQMRETINTDAVREYVDNIERLPPVVTFFDGIDHWLGDGFHRYHAHRSAGKLTIEADVRGGTKRDAILYAVNANATHGLRRTNADKRKAVTALLNDKEWSQWSDREIARRCGVSHDFVSRLRASHLSSDDRYDQPRKVTRNGTTYTQKPKRQAPKPQAVEVTTEPVIDTMTRENPRELHADQLVDDYGIKWIEEVVHFLRVKYGVGA